MTLIPSNPSQRSIRTVFFASLIAGLLIAPAFAQDASLAGARRLFAAGSYNQASHLLETTLKSNPRNADAHLLLGQIYAIQGQRSEAIQQFTSAIELQPNSALAYNTLGSALNRFAEFEQARTAFEQAIKIDPTFAQAHINLAMSLAQSNDMPGATEQLQTAIKIWPNTPAAATAHYLLAKIYQDQDPQHAIEELTTSVKIQPTGPDAQQAWLALGNLRNATNDPAAALFALKHAVACDPHDPESQYELGSAYLEQGDVHQAAIHLELARKSMPAITIAVLYKLDRALRKEGSIAEADRVRAQAKSLLAQDSEANQHFQEAQTLDHDGVELEAKGETARALEKYHAALELNPQQDGFRLNYALALCRLNRWQQGIAELEDILQRDPGNIEVRRALFIARDKARQASTTHP
jgi:tetratricopeptide (TPR) repeat protein